MHLVHLVRQTIAWSILSKEYLFFDLAVYIFMYTPWLLASTHQLQNSLYCRPLLFESGLFLFQWSVQVWKEGHARSLACHANACCSPLSVPRLKAPPFLFIAHRRPPWQQPSGKKQRGQMLYRQQQMFFVTYIHSLDRNVSCIEVPSNNCQNHVGHRHCHGQSTFLQFLEFRGGDGPVLVPSLSANSSTIQFDLSKPVR